MAKAKTGVPGVLNATNDLAVWAETPPAHLDAIAQEHWTDTLHAFSGTYTFDQIDLSSFSLMCEAWSEFVRASAGLKKEQEEGVSNGIYTVTKNGNIIQHPLVSVKNQAAERYLRFAKEFGMTPAARAKIAENQVSTVDKLKKYMG